MNCLTVYVLNKKPLLTRFSPDVSTRSRRREISLIIYHNLMKFIKNTTCVFLAGSAGHGEKTNCQIEFDSLSLVSIRLPYCRANGRKFSLCVRNPKLFVSPLKFHNASSSAVFTYELRSLPPGQLCLIDLISVNLF